MNMPSEVAQKAESRRCPHGTRLQQHPKSPGHLGLAAAAMESLSEGVTFFSLIVCILLAIK